LSYRQVEELMQERGVSGDHATINRWVVKYSPQLEQAFHRRECPVWRSRHMDETYMCATKHKDERGGNPMTCPGRP
jgi:transposase-like protein